MIRPDSHSSFERCLIIILLILAPLFVSADVHVFVIDGYKDYNGDAAESTTIASPYFMDTKYSVSDGFQFAFRLNGSSMTNRVITDKDKRYGLLFKGNILRFTPQRGKEISMIRIGTVNDFSDGFIYGNGKSVSRVGNVYEWKGCVTSTLDLLLSGADARSSLGFMYIEVTYGNEFIGDNPETPDDPEPIAEVVISPDEQFIASYQKISIGCDTKDVTIYYTTDGTRPSKSSRRYSKPFTLSLYGGMDVWATAVSPDGQTSEARRRFYFDSVTNIYDFFENDSPEPTTIDVPLQIVYRNGSTSYLRDVSTDEAEYVCVSDPGNYLRGIAEGRVLDGVRGVVGYDSNTPAVELSVRPVVVRSEELPAPDTLSLQQITDADLHRYIAVTGCRVNTQGVISQSMSRLELDDRFGVVTPSLTEKDVTVTGFVSLDRGGMLAVRPVEIELLTEPVDPSDPDIPSEPTLCIVNSVCVGEGSIDIFADYNSYTLTPVGMPLGSNANVAKGDSVYIYFHPADGYGVASVVAGEQVITPSSVKFADTVYGEMTGIRVENDMTIVVTFTPVSSAVVSEADLGKDAEWFDLKGRKLTDVPDADGVYILKQSGKVIKVKLNRE